MGSFEAAEHKPSSIPKLPVFSILPMSSPEHSGMLTPPLQTFASVPFRWEEEPGKPRPCTTLVTLHPNNNEPKCLDLPPRLLVESKITTKTPSPNTVLDGPDGDKSVFSSSSFKFLSKGGGGSFGSSGWSPEKGKIGSMVLGKRRNKRRGIFGSWGNKTLKLVGGGKRQVGGGGFVFPSSMDVADCSDGENGSKRVRMGRIRRNGSFSTLSQPRSQFWDAIYEGLKKAVQWSRKSKKDGFAT